MINEIIIFNTTLFNDIIGTFCVRKNWRKKQSINTLQGRHDLLQLKCRANFYIFFKLTPITVINLNIEYKNYFLKRKANSTDMAIKLNFHSLVFSFILSLSIWGGGGG